MAKSQIDLDDLSPDEKVKEDEKPKRASSRNSRNTGVRAEKDLRDRLAACFERIANALDERGDPEMAELVREDGEIMSQGLVSLTRPFTILRTPLLAVIAVIEPVLAFGRIVRLSLFRWAQRRERVAQERDEAAAAEAQQE